MSVNTATLPADDEAIKNQLYNRQQYVVGAETQRKYASSDVLLVGLTGLGLEIAKNLVLTGVRTLTIVDDTPISWHDLSSLFYATEADVHHPRAATLLGRIAELNRFVNVRVEKSPSGAEGLDALIQQHHVAIFCDKATTTLTAENEMCRRHNVKFVACESRGLMGCIFVDAGDAFLVVDPNAEETVSCVVTGFSSDGVVSCHEDKKHECAPGDRVYFTQLDGAHAAANSPNPQVPVLFNVLDNVNPFVLKIELPASLQDAIKAAGTASNQTAVSLSAGYMHTTKAPVTLQFKPLAAAIAEAEFSFIDDDETKLTAPSELHAIFRAIHQQLRGGAQGGEALSAATAASIVAAAKAFEPSLNEQVALALSATAHGNLNAMACFIGGIASQEVLKCASGKFTPIKQWLYYDARELLKCGEMNELLVAGGSAVLDRQPRSDRYDGQTAVIGHRAQAKMQQQHAFIVGAGALGCELVKNLACMGLGCGSPQSSAAAGGSVVVTDMDVIELSNLSRQFLFRTHHIGQHKSRCAAAAAHAINKDLRISHMELKVAPDTETTFDDHFWKTKSLVINALDNVQARRYVDAKCVSHAKPLFDSGTLGAKCNTQTVIPHLTESYGSSNDPPEKSFPICTLHNFPNSIEHTIAWAKDKFQAAFVSQPSDVNAYLHNADFLESLEKDPGQKPVVFQSVIEGLGRRPRSAEDCVQWARRRFEELFVNNILQLLHNLPLDKLTPEGQPFWSGAKRPPKPLAFDPADSLHVDFVYHAACLQEAVYGLTTDVARMPRDALARIAASTTVDSFVPRQQAYVTSEKEGAAGAAGGVQPAPPPPPPVIAAHDLTAADLPPKSMFQNIRLFVTEFEKDDDANHHVDFITAVSNLRATNYGIPVADRIRTKMIAGRIIPAMVTTTALVTGLVGLEIMKYVLGCKDRAVYRNAFVNISLPLFAFSEPSPPPGAVNYTSRDGRAFTFTMWDSLDINEGRDISLKELIALLNARWGLEITMMSLADGTMIFSDFATKPERMAMGVAQVVALIKKAPIDERIRSLEIIVCAEANGVEVNIPSVRYHL